MSNPYDNKEWVETHKENIRRFYREILMREPESEQVVYNWAMSNPDINEVKKNFYVGATEELKSRMKTKQSELERVIKALTETIEEKDREINQKNETIRNMIGQSAFKEAMIDTLQKNNKYLKNVCLRELFHKKNQPARENK
jgi:hypothetical protein